MAACHVSESSRSVGGPVTFTDEELGSWGGGGGEGNDNTETQESRG